MRTKIPRTLIRNIESEGFIVKKAKLGLDTPEQWLILDHLTYPGIEAHVFTAAHAALWQPSFTSDYDIKLTYSDINFKSLPSSQKMSSVHTAILRLLSSFQQLGSLLDDYKKRLSSGIFPAVIWAHIESRWHVALRNAPYHGLLDMSKYMAYIDPSIRPIISRLNRFGFRTMESCSGLPEEHPDREPYWPYVMFDERAYPGIAPHLFTLADIAGWIPVQAPHSFDVYLRKQKHVDTRIAWTRLESSAENLSHLLSNYHESNSLFPTDLQHSENLQGFATHTKRHDVLQ